MYVCVCFGFGVDRIVSVHINKYTYSSYFKYIYSVYVYNYVHNIVYG